MRIAVVANSSWYLFNFRLNLIRALEKAGHEVIAVGSPDDYADRIAKEGFKHASVAFSAVGTNPLTELRTVSALTRVFREYRVEAILSYTPKGNIYSGFASFLRGIPIVPNVSGLGRIFVRPSALTTFVKVLYRIVLRRSAIVFFQNRDDMDLFVRAGIVPRSKADLVPGSGVDLSRFTPTPINGQYKPSTTTFLLIARLLWDKGVGEYVEAARIVRKEYPETRFQLLGILDGKNANSVPASTVDAWAAEGVVECLGRTDDVRTFLSAADCVVLPSYYREGVPRSLLEAAAMGRAVITTDAIGCRDTVEDGITGLLCKPGSSKDLAEKILRFRGFDQKARNAMGMAGRRRMERLFDEKFVINRYLDVIGSIAARR